MAVKFYLTDNTLTQDDPNDKMAVVTGVESYDDAAIAGRMLRRGSTVTEADILAVLQNFRQEIGYIVEEGGAINSDIFSAHPSVSGKFVDANDSFDHKRHRLNYNLSLGTSIKTSMQKTKTQKVATPDNGPIIASAKDSISGLSDGTLTPNGVLELNGSRLKIITDMPDNGVFFIADDGTEHKVNTLVENKPARLLVMIPNMHSGNYHVEVRTNSTSSGVAGKQLHSFRYDKVFTVAELPT